MKKERDWLDYVNIILVALIPALVTVFGIVISNKNNQIAQFQRNREIEISKANVKISHAKLVGEYAPFLSSPEEFKRQIAVNALVYAMNEDSSTKKIENFLSAIVDIDDNQSVKNTAIQLLSQLPDQYRLKEGTEVTSKDGSVKVFVRDVSGGGRHAIIEIDKIQYKANWDQIPMSFYSNNKIHKITITKIYDRESKMIDLEILKIRTQ